MIFNRVGSLLLHALAHIPAIQISALMWWNWSSWYKLLGSTPWICRYAACLKFAPVVTCPAPSKHRQHIQLHVLWYCKFWTRFCFLWSGHTTGALWQTWSSWCAWSCVGPHQGSSILESWKACFHWTYKNLPVWSARPKNTDFFQNSTRLFSWKESTKSALGNVWGHGPTTYSLKNVDWLNWVHDYGCTGRCLFPKHCYSSLLEQPKVREWLCWSQNKL